MFDSCFSGAGGRSVLPAGARPLVRVKETTAPAGGHVAVFSASDGTEISGPSADGTQGGLLEVSRAGPGRRLGRRRRRRTDHAPRARRLGHAARHARGVRRAPRAASNLEDHRLGRLCVRRRLGTSAAMKTRSATAFAVAASLFALDAAATDSPADYADRTKAAAAIEKEEAREEALSPSTRFFAFARGSVMSHFGNHVGGGNTTDINAVTKQQEILDAEFGSLTRESFGAGVRDSLPPRGIRRAGAHFSQLRDRQHRIQRPFHLEVFALRLRGRGRRDDPSSFLRRLTPLLGPGPELGYGSYAASGLPPDEGSAILVHGLLELGIFLGAREEIEVAARLSCGVDVLYPAHRHGRRQSRRGLRLLTLRARLDHVRRHRA